MPLQLPKPAESLIVPPATAPAAAAPKTRRRRAVRSLLRADVIFNRPWFITRPGLESIIADFRLYEDDDDDEPCDPDTDPTCPDYPVSPDGIAMIPITGGLYKARLAFRYSFATSYMGVAAMCANAMGRDDVKSILLCFDSPGGQASGMFDLCDAMYAMRGQKPMAAISDDACYSAAYCLGSVAEKMFVTRTAGVGSIGCWTAHADLSKMLDKMGVDITYIFAGAKKVDGNSTEPLPDSVKTEWQSEVDRMRTMFVQAVARNRGVSADALLDTEAGIFMAEAACPLLADSVGTVADACTYLRGRMAEAAPVPVANGPGDKEGPFSITINGIANGQAFAQSVPFTSGSYPTTITLGNLWPVELNATAVPPHKTATEDGAWDGPAEEKKLDSPMPLSIAKAMYAWYDGGKVDAGKINKADARFPHHAVSDGKPGAANVKACQSGIGVLNGGRGGTTIPKSDRQGVYNHLAKHLKDAGLTPAPLKSEAQLAAMLYLEDTSGEEHGYDPLELLSGHENATEIKVSKTFSHHAALLLGLRDLKTEYPAAIAAVRTFERRASVDGGKDSRKIKLLIAPYGSTAKLGSFDERYRPGCFGDVTTGDPRVLAFHAETNNLVLGRVSSGTARFWSDDEGVWAEATAPDTTWASDLLASMRRADVRDASAAFYILKASYETMADGRKLRWIEKALLVDGSVESMGAYPGATSQAQDQRSSAADMNRRRLQIARLR